MECHLPKEIFFEKKIELDTFILIDEIDDTSLIDELVIDVKEGVKKSQINRKTNIIGDHTNFDYLVNNPKFHKFLQKIRASIYKVYKQNFVVKNVWGNIYSKPLDHAKPHNHQDSVLCGILYCTDEIGPGTYFEQHDLLIKEKKGRFVLFHPHLLHEVRPYNYTKERITIAWNFFGIRKWENINNAYYIKKIENIKI
jgi:hypothetical protein